MYNFLDNNFAFVITGLVIMIGILSLIIINDKDENDGI